MTRTRIVAFAGCVLLVLGAAYLRDPPWVGQITSGMREWETELRRGTRFRWTTGRASFFVPSEAKFMTLPLRPGFPAPDGGPVTVSISVDGRWLADVELRQPQEWVRTSLPLPQKEASRRFRRIDLHVSRTIVGPFIFGVQTGEIELDQTP
jgi:hypothetical protein